MGLRVVHGKEMSADDDAILLEIPHLLRIFFTYTDSDIWNADEFGLFYRQALSWTFSQGPVSGFKKEKAQILCLTYCNSYDTEHIPLIIIGNAQKLPIFNGKTGQELGLN